ncbi:MAG: hypothetical protein H6814_08365 [Phycisphaeraceae bacterium]|nr:hypothetical protein [Phycisphaeraceae bacterium]
MAAPMYLFNAFAFGGFSFDSISVPILSAKFRADFAELTAERMIGSTNVNMAMLVDPRDGGLGMLDITDELFGPGAGPATIALGLTKTGVFEADIDDSFFPALATGNVGLWALFTDTDDGRFGIDYLSLLIETEVDTIEVFFQGMGNDGFKITPNPPADGADLSAPFQSLRPFGATGTGFDETISSKAIHVLPSPGAGALLAMGGLALTRRRRSRRVRAHAVIAASLACAATAAQATQTIPLDTDQMVRQSGSVVYGMVERVETAWNADHNQIWTTAQVRVVEYWKGWSPDDLIEVSYLGGTVGDLTYIVVDQPRLEVNEEVVLYLQESRIAPLPFTGMSQGKLTVEINPLNGERVVRETGRPLTVQRTDSLQAAQRHRVAQEPARRELERVSGVTVVDLDALHIGPDGNGAPAAGGDQ